MTEEEQPELARYRSRNQVDEDVVPAAIDRCTNGELLGKQAERLLLPLAEGDVRALNYFVAQKYVEAMQQIGASPNSRLVLMPMETGGLVGTIAGIAELARTVTRPVE